MVGRRALLFRGGGVRVWGFRGVAFRGLGFRAWGFELWEYMAWGLGLRVFGVGLRVHGLGFLNAASGLRSSLRVDGLPVAPNPAKYSSGLGFRV